MLTIAYLANEFPSLVEPYVGDEVAELKRRGVYVITGSVRKSRSVDRAGKVVPDLIVQRVSPTVVAAALWLCLKKWKCILFLIRRLALGCKEGPVQRAKAVIHTFFGACYAVMLTERGVEHIHVHHGYFGSWIAMVAARLLDVGFSLTLHGSDLLLHGTYLDVKLAACSFCVTISEYNRAFILARYPHIPKEKIVVSRLGVDVPDRVTASAIRKETNQPSLTILTVGRLHAVKDHAFLIRASAGLSALGLRFECWIAGEGPERRNLESLIRKYGMGERVRLLGHVRREDMDSLYQRADVVVLTSRSEGIPLVLMEAMARGKIVVAPAITGIPELVIPGKTGFLYSGRSMDDFIDSLLLVHSLLKNQPDVARGERHPGSDVLRSIQRAARAQVQQNFERSKNLERFASTFLERITTRRERVANENLVLQQVQLPL